MIKFSFDKEIQFLKESKDKPIFIKFKGNIRIYNNSYILEIPISKFINNRINIDNIPEYTSEFEDSPIFLNGISFTLLHDCSLKVRTYKPIVIRDIQKSRIESIFNYIRNKINNEEMQYEDKVAHNVEGKLIIDYKNIVIEDRFNALDYLFNDYLNNVVVYEKILVNYFILNRIINEEFIVKTGYVNSPKRKDGTPYHRVYENFIDVSTNLLSRIYVDDINFFKRINKLNNITGGY